MLNWFQLNCHIAMVMQIIIILFDNEDICIRDTQTIDIRRNSLHPRGENFKGKISLLITTSQLLHAGNICFLGNIASWSEAVFTDRKEKKYACHSLLRQMFPSFRHYLKIPNMIKINWLLLNSPFNEYGEELTFH